ncbi:bifunctional protein-serine/threonine kinase/phosphatase [Hyphomicrobium sp. CS1GBMeth3]|uniref:bifunctional protein-serine/threonine kinase/phosphatase n=1 Tax=Hyphomicrobium sp. CS1GBMeth3 TaxID=1892845 RepID=UPI0009318A9A|nr:bifunctional protein-serine/threonine kinase/phosphatase [Hyphomicrobium sp. CS1GBMeth3]
MPIGPAVTIGQHSLAGRKARNDDSYGVLVPEPALLETKGVAMAIADGMSSSEAAKMASETCVHSFLDDYYSTHPSWTVKTSVQRVLTAINRWLHGQSEANYASDRGMVCTFTALVLKSAVGHVFHVGDSRIYLVRGETIELLTNDHRVRVSRDQEYLSRAVGIAPDLQVDYKTVPLEAGDILVFTTDGVHDFLRDTQISSILRASGDDLTEAAKQIVAAAFANGSPDNLTCQIVRIDDAGHPDEEAHLKKLTALPMPPELVPGQDFEGYTILRELHLSKRTQIYLAREGQSGTTVVLKTPSVNYEDDPVYLEMFTREEWVGQLVTSPHVLKVLRPAHVRRSLYYVTEYFEGQTLRQWMLDHPRPDLETVRGIIEQIAKGLRAFHRKEIIHQDLKPENVMIDKAGTVKIIDFGSSRVASLAEASISVQKPDLVGTIDYTAPEYHLGETPTNRSDIFSVGVIAYELLTGKLPYGRGFGHQRDIARLEYIPASSLNEAVPRWVDAALARAVYKSPTQRAEALSVLVEDLRRPNPDYRDEPRALLERNPVAFWRGLSVVQLVLNLLLLYHLSR